mmetsp:Transcript_21667/g.32887  ORF Transcript_21667/g.32887 Transcript_21667/m.32887 type:complete len:664 (-) Transcript_21667:619-2610(-)
MITSKIKSQRTIFRYMSTNSSMLKRWSQPIVESNGDYDAETFLEDSKLPLYKYQNDLPWLPVPSLENTAERFLPTALPLVETKEEENSLRQAVSVFPEQAKYLQQRLEARASTTSSWLQLWWNTMGYLQLRDPVVINISYFFNLPEDSSLIRNSKNDKTLCFKRGASLLKAAWEYRQLVCSGDLPQEKIGKQQTPLCSVGFKYLFHSCRIPKPNQDSYRLYDPSVFTHATVACGGQFFEVPLVDEEGCVYSLASLEESLLECHQQATQKETIEIGYLTTSNRDQCARARSELVRLGGAAMEKALTKVESGMLLLCLDSHVKPSSLKQCAKLYWHGDKKTSNRWYDKVIQLVVTGNGQLGYVGEHALLDGMPAVGFCQYLLKSTYGRMKSVEEEESTVTSSSKPLINNIFDPVLCMLDDSDTQMLQKLVDEAKNDFDELVDSNELEFLRFQNYGKNFIKKAGFSPDAYIQMAIQLATFRLFGKQVATYESSQVRKFLHGRTETTRSISPASNAFCKAMGPRPNDPRQSKPIKLQMLRDATDSHTSFTRLASDGQGVDRHLLALSILAENGEKLPSLLSHPLHARSKLWRVSTSTLPGMSPGFGPVCDTGVGIGYDIKDDSCVFTVTSLKKHGWTDTLCHHLEESLIEMKDLTWNQDGALPTSKL